MKTIRGEPVTDQDIQDWSDEAERAYDLEQLRRRERRTVGTDPARSRRPTQVLAAVWAVFVSNTWTTTVL